MVPSEINYYKKQNAVIAALMGRSARRNGHDADGFYIGGKVVCPKCDDIELIFDIRDGNLPIHVGTGLVNRPHSWTGVGLTATLSRAC